MKNMIRTGMTAYANLDERTYRNYLQFRQDRYNTPKKWLKRLQDGRLNYIKQLKKFNPHGTIIELGAGSAWLSSELSKIPEVKRVYCLDFSEKILSKITPVMMNYLNADVSKITRIVGDFNRLEFGDNHFDFVFFDAALHHVTNIDLVLSEVRRALKPGGMLIAIREPVVPILRPWLKLNFGKEDREQGVTENIYTIQEWKRFFERNGFKLGFHPFLSSNKKGFGLLNKWPFSLFNKYIFAHMIFSARKE